MQLVKRTYLIFILLLGAFSSNAQLLNDVCINEILALEKKTFSSDYANTEKTIHINYTIQSVDWNGKTMTSNVKIYRHKKKLNFFSEQANMFQDDKNSIIVLKPQKVLIVNGVAQNIPSNYSDEFVKTRMEFLKSCEVLRCEQGSVKNVKVLELKSKEKLGGTLKVDRMIYTYNTSTGKLLKCVTYYDKGFQVKKTVLEFKVLDFNNSYKFSKAAKNYVFDKKGRVLSAYKAHELIDNTKR